MSNIYGATALTGGGTKALDGSTYYDGDDLVDGDGAIVITSSSVYAFHLDAASGAAENSPLVISPDANAGTKRWLLKSGVFAGLTLYGNIIMPDGGSIGQAAGPLLNFNDTTNILNITGCNIGVRTTNPNSDGFHGPVLALNTAVNQSTAFILKQDEVSKGHFRMAADGSIEMRTLGVPFAVRVISNYPITFFTSNIERFKIDGAGKTTFAQSLFIKEIAAANGDIAAYGQIWVKNTVPNQLWFTRDDGTDVQIA